MTNALTIYNQFDQLQKAATALQQSGYFKDVTSQAQAIVKVMAGAELGLPPFASMAGIHIIQGKPALGANVVATLVKNDPRYNYRVQTCTNTACEITWYEDGKISGNSSFTIEEAKAAGLTGKDNWNKFPSDMLFARAITRGARRFAPGIFGGSPVYTPEELGADTDEDGHVMIDLQAKDAIQFPADTQEDKAPIEQGQPSASMDLETAKLVATSGGKLYGAMDTKTLHAVIRSIEGALQANHLPQERREELNYKLDAAKTVLASLK